MRRYEELCRSVVRIILTSQNGTFFINQPTAFKRDRVLSVLLNCLKNVMQQREHRSNTRAKHHSKNKLERQSLRQVLDQPCGHLSRRPAFLQEKYRTAEGRQPYRK